MDGLIHCYEDSLSEELEVLAEQEKLPDNLDIYDISELYTSDTKKQFAIRGVLFDAYRNKELKAHEGLRPNKVIGSLGRKTEKRGGVLVVLFNDNEITFHKRDFKQWLIVKNQWPLKDCLLANWWGNDDLDKKGHGFTVHNPCKTIPVLYKALTVHSLVKDEGFDKFSEAFENGNGFIIWNSGLNSLIYFTNKMIKNVSLIECSDFIKTTQSIFRGRGEVTFKYTSLNTANGRNNYIPPKNAKIIDLVIDELNSLA